MTAPTHPLRTNRALLTAAIDVALTMLAMLLSSEVRLVLPFGKDLMEPTVRVNGFVYLLTALIWLAVFAQTGLYTRRRLRQRDEVSSVTLAVFVALLILAGGLYMSFRQISRLQFIYFGGLDLLFLVAARVVRAAVSATMKDRDHSAWRILIAGSGPTGQQLAAQLVADGDRPSQVRIVGYIDDDAAMQEQLVNGLRVIGTLEQALAIIEREQISEIILALPREKNNRLLELIMELEGLQTPIQVSLVPDVLDLAWFRMRVDDVNGVPLLRLRDSPLNGPARMMKRLMDIVIGAIALVIAAPVMLVVALIIRLDSPGPVIIRQRRIGENAQPFEMLKFRTMIAREKSEVRDQRSEVGEERQEAGSDKQEARDEKYDVTRSGQKVETTGEWQPAKRVSEGEDQASSLEDAAGHSNLQSPFSNLLLKQPDDPRVTRAGRVLRRYSLDELPQLLNVLRGQMSLVGPRPELPWLVDAYEPWQRHRFAVPPGMTGWWQVNGRSDRPMHQNVEDDLYYIRNYSLWLDVAILLRTIPAVLSGKGAY